MIIRSSYIKLESDNGPLEIITPDKPAINIITDNSTRLRDAVTFLRTNTFVKIQMSRSVYSEYVDVMSFKGKLELIQDCPDYKEFFPDNTLHKMVKSHNINSCLHDSRLTVIKPTYDFSLLARQLLQQNRGFTKPNLTNDLGRTWITFRELCTDVNARLYALRCKDKTYAISFPILKKEK